MNASGRLVRLSVVAAAVSMAAAVGCNKRPATTGGTSSTKPRMVVAASIYPIADVLGQVGGGRVEVLTFHHTDQSPHGYRPTPDQVEQLAPAKLLVVVGLGLDDWARRSVAGTGQGGCKILDLSAVVGPTTIPTSATTTTAADAPDPYVWLDPMKVIGMTDAMAKALSELDPDDSSLYTANAASYQKELRALDRECAERLGGLSRKEILTLHATFGHFAARYGLRRIAFRPDPPGTSGPIATGNVVTFVRRHEGRFLFAGPRFPVAQLDDIAKRAGIDVDRLDPFGAPDVAGHDSYLALMRTNLAALVSGLSK